MIINRLRPKTAGIPGATLYLQSNQELRIGGRGTATQYQYSLTADNLKDLNEWSPKLMEAMQKLPELKDVATDQQDQGLRAQLVIDRDTASRLGVSPLTIDATLSDAFGQRQVSTTYRPLNQYHVVMEVAPEYQRNPDSLKNIYVKSTTGAMIPLSAITHFEAQRIPLTVNHQSQSPATTLSFNLTPGSLPEPGYCGDRTGAREYRDAFDDPWWLPGHGTGLPGFAVERTGTDTAGPGSGLYCAGNAV